METPPYGTVTYRTPAARADAIAEPGPAVGRGVGRVATAGRSTGTGPHAGAGGGTTQRVREKGQGAAVGQQAPGWRGRQLTIPGRETDATCHQPRSVGPRPAQQYEGRRPRPLA